MIFAFISLHVLSYISSILPGCILPSFIKFSIVTFAISLLSGSKLESTIVSGVSSIIKSTPVTASIVLIFLPSLPIILPFISSFGKLITDIVASFVTSDAYFCIASVNKFFAFLSTSSFASASLSFIYAAISLVIDSSTCFMTIFLASSLENPEIFSSFSSCSFKTPSVFSSNAWISFCLCTKLFSFSDNKFSLSWRIWSLLSILFSLCCNLSSKSFTSSFFSLTSLSTSCFNLYCSSFISKIVSLFNFSASFFAFSIILSDFFSFDFIISTAPNIVSSAPKINPRVENNNFSIFSLHDFYLYILILFNLYILLV